MNIPFSKLSSDQWEQVISALDFYISVKRGELEAFNAGDREWQELVDYENTLKDIQYYILMK